MCVVVSADYKIFPLEKKVYWPEEIINKKKPCYVNITNQNKYLE